ncbi:maleylpyruvate isomerase family mycothiol-dependent enzyme [Planotetraspora sp. A-T 1434]|uniref:maleylpyruvate isomerase family mycothiol-dependent enzyme n=1 Tax=Planotetraspora sp. A-T 1434 TaxID=2979219 RepID=UPI0021C1EA75|nr:maleylpyruvate isomerase family mycothiol-dependent enzyme [Planotetraspora sp. A-T 1434]MCT9929665.1 maleylpyruvate isomerase family mycothiol-dependent enzyme [Planotetraspora sp. A-T 1434]
MAGEITHGQWDAARGSLRETGERFAAMVCSTRDPHAKVTAEWSVAETAAHVGTIASWYTAIMDPDGISHPFPTLEQDILGATVDTVAKLNEQVLSEYTERDPEALAERLRADIDRILEGSERLDPAKPVLWLGSARVPVAGVVAHLVNELMIHGWDIARATGARWPMRPQDAALFFDLFLVGMLRHDIGRLGDDNEASKGDRRIAVEFHSRHTAPVTIVLHRGRLSVEDPGPGADVRLSFDPVALHLMLFGRISKARAALTGKVLVRGPRPWLLPAFLRFVRLPSNSHPRSPGA